MDFSHVSLVFLVLSNVDDCSLRMHSIRVHKVIALMISFFYLIGFWHRGDKPTARDLKIKLFYCIYYLVFLLSLAVGAVTNENKDVCIFLTEASIGITAVTVKLWILIWKQNEILELLNRVCVFSIRDVEDVAFFNKKLGRFMKFVVVFLTAALAACCFEVGVLPFLGSEKTLFLEVGFPLDWKENDIVFWIEDIFIFTEYIISLTVVLFSIIIWYLLLNCSLRYELLGSELKKTGQISEEMNVEISEKQMHNYYFEGLKASIDVHLHIRELGEELESFFANLFLIQFGTSGLCVCGSIYCLAFDVGDNLVERLMYIFTLCYFIAELFMITYFGNEIKLSSSRLSYSLFESNWYEQPQSTKKCIIVFSEYLKQPQELLIGKLYPLTLETFTKILNSAYNMFNILKSFQQ